MKLLLFDIDGTLLRAGHQVGPIFLGALEQTFGRVVDRGDYSFAGRTDSQIVVDLMGRSGLPREQALDALPQLRTIYLERLERQLDARQMILLPGVQALLSRLARRRDVALGLLTGNFRDGARIKLSRLGLDGFFAVGAYGDDGIERSELPPVALLRARDAFRYDFEAKDTVIIGDTPHDIRCAQAHSMSVFAVATGTCPRPQLEAAGATWVGDDLATLESTLGLSSP